MCGALPEGSGLHIPPRCLPVPPSLPPAAPRSGSPAALRQKVSSHLFLKRLRRSRVRRAAAAASFPPAPPPPPPTVAREPARGWQPPAQGRPTAAPASAVPAGRVFLPLPAFPAVRSRPRRRREAALAQGDAEGLPGPAPPSPQGCVLLSSGCRFSPGPRGLMFSASPRCRWPRASELSALLTRARKSALTASGHCVKNGNCLRGSRGLSLPQGDRVAISPPVPPNAVLLAGSGRGAGCSRLPRDP